MLRRKPRNDKENMSDRIYKINELLREEVSNIMLRELRDHEGFITVTAVETTPDLRYSTIWYSVIGADESKIEKLIMDSERSIQKVLNSRLILKHVPKISFRLDKSGDYVNKINRLINETKNDQNKE